MQAGSLDDWRKWSREAVQIMQERNRAFLERFALSGNAYRWDLEAAQIAFISGERTVIADLAVVGLTSQSEGTFLWAWAHETIPPQAREGMDEVRVFGERHDLGLLTTAEWPGGRAEGMEMLAVAGRVLDAEGAFVAPDGDRTLFFTLHRFRTQPLCEVTWLRIHPDKQGAAP